ncbi:DUF6252 family protein [Aequorivita sp. SDUM287046]|uniref:DUF6252 family protein n=1 Tax=Aequorivita aurantiaca TaxID=3053356 RepID=A0ABT8DJK8_9FLAO|nr:DUF6252 family protein [Aequorivita aurantiaca]MDN3723202.1 DUF6252 family protein [Aequorivita aurantiaca]
MKKQFMKFGLIAFLTLIAVGCNKDDDSNNNNGAADGELVAKVDGDEFKVSTQVGATLYAGTFNITAVQPSTGETIVITVSNAEEGTFDLGPNANAQNGAVYMISGQDAYGSVGEGGSGEIKITKLDLENEIASGTFSFTAVRQTLDANGNIITETVEITEGSFTNVALATTIAGGNSTLQAKVNGSDLNADSVTALEITFGGNTTIAITANNNSTNQNLSLSFPGDITVGTYSASEFVGMYNPSLGGGTNNYAAQTGTLTISAININAGTVEGTFSFTAKRLDPNDPDVTYEITEGSFSAEF